MISSEEDYVDIVDDISDIMPENNNILSKEYTIHPEDAYPVSHLSEDICVEKMNPDLVCPICLGILQNVVVDCCGHAYCNNCLATSMKHSYKCPKTNLYWEFKSMAPMPILQNLLNSLKIKCIHSERGCKWTGNLEQLKAHVNNECNSIRIQCRNKGCEVFESRETMSEHEKQCQFYELTCKSCNTKLMRKDYQGHENYKCPEHSVSCSEGCGQQMKRKDCHEHVHNDCPNFKVICQFSSIGCKTAVPRKSYDEHLKNDVSLHLRLTLTLLSELNGRVKKLEVENEKLRQKNSA